VASLGVEQIQNDGRCHGNQGAKNVKFTPNFTNVCSCNGNKKVGILIFFLFLSSNFIKMIIAGYSLNRN
jgi:hypothetical protein